MGGALRAMGSGTTGIYLNPAALPEVRLYHLEALAQITPETGRNVYGGTIVDSTTSRLAGAFSILGGFMDKSGGIDRSFIDVRLALAYPITDRFILGLGGRYLRASQSGVAYPPYGFGWSPVSGGLADPTSTTFPPLNRTAMVDAITFDAGLVIKPSDNFYLALTGQNLTYPKNGLLPTTVGGGIGFGSEIFSVEADGIADLNSWLKPTARVGGGAEVVIGGMVPIRGGYRYDTGAKLNTVSLGTGFTGQIFSIEATVKRTISNPGATTMFFSIAYFLESSGMTKSSGPSTDPTQ
jgi:hypothetical protein